MIKHIKILLILFALVISFTASALIDTQEFKKLCNYPAKHKVDDLKQSLAEASSDDFYLWLSSFDDIYASPLIYATYKGNVSIIKLLIETCLKHDINYWEFITSTGISILSVAASEQHLFVVELLLKYNHPVAMELANSTSALHQAAKRDDIAICRLIIEKDTSLIHCKDIKQMTPINYLIENNKFYYVLELLENFPVDKNMIPLDMNGRSYLHYAVSNYMVDVVHCLLESGFDCNQKDSKGVTPLGLSRYQEDNTILQIFEEENRNRKYKYCCCFKSILSRSDDKEENITFYNPQQKYDYLD